MGGIQIPQQRCNQHHRQVCLMLFPDLFGMPESACDMTDAFEVTLQVPLDRDSHTILEQIFLLGHQLRRQVSQALFGVLAVGSAPEIHFGVDESVPAAAASACRVVLEELHPLPALGAFNLKNRIRTPILGILSGAFHGPSPATACRKRPLFPSVERESVGSGVSLAQNRL
jgi:hypothetical protein